MTSVVQTSLFDLPDPGAGLGALGGLVTRQVLGRGAWVDVLPGWLGGADDLFDGLLQHVPWQAEQRALRHPGRRWTALLRPSGWVECDGA